MFAPKWRESILLLNGLSCGGSFEGLLKSKITQRTCLSGFSVSLPFSVFRVSSVRFR